MDNPASEIGSLLKESKTNPLTTSDPLPATTVTSRLKVGAEPAAGVAPSGPHRTESTAGSGKALPATGRGDPIAPWLVAENRLGFERRGCVGFGPSVPPKQRKQP